MDEDDVPDEIIFAAKESLERAIAAFYAQIQPDAYIESWVLVVHKLTPEMEQENTSSVAYMVPNGQAFPMTRGLLDVALSADRDI